MSIIIPLKRPIIGPVAFVAGNDILAQDWDECAQLMNYQWARTGARCALYLPPDDEPYETDSTTYVVEDDNHTGYPLDRYVGALRLTREDTLDGPSRRRIQLTGSGADIDVEVEVRLASGRSLLGTITVTSGVGDVLTGTSSFDPTEYAGDLLTLHMRAQTTDTTARMHVLHAHEEVLFTAPPVAPVSTSDPVVTVAQGAPYSTFRPQITGGT